MSAYGEYRRPAQPWVKRIPRHWEERRGKVFFREVNDRSDSGVEELLSVSHLTGVTPRSQKNVTMFKAESYVGHKRCQPGDIVVNTMWAWMAALGVARHVGLVSPAYGTYRLQDREAFEPAYLDYLVRSHAYVAEYNCRSTGIQSSRLRLYPAQFLDIHFIRPPKEEQAQIVRYLRALDAKIGRFIRDKRRLIEVLNEQKQTLIHRAVTRGLDPNVKLKPTGVEWLGEVPERWIERRLKFVATNVTAQTDTQRADEIYLALEHVESWTGRMNPPPERVVFSSTVKQFQKDDILFGKLRPYLAKVVRPQAVGVCVSEFFVLRANSSEVLPAYLEILLRTKKIIELVNSSTAGAKMPRADWTNVGNLRLAFPPPSAQADIVAWLAKETADLDKAIADANDEIGLIREYRDRLIADVVTGQIDVRGWVPGPEDVVDEAALSTEEDETPEDEGVEDDDGHE